MEAKQHKYGLDRWYILKVDKGSDITAAVNSFRAVAEVETAQPAFVIKSIAAPIIKITGTLKKPLDASSDTPPVNDPYYWLQWHYHNTGQEGGYTGADIDLEPAWPGAGLAGADPVLDPRRGDHDRRQHLRAVAR
jgi:hypothetical protein